MVETPSFEYVLLGLPLSLKKKKKEIKGGGGSKQIQLAPVLGLPDYDHSQLSHINLDADDCLLCGWAGAALALTYVGGMRLV